MTDATFKAALRALVDEIEGAVARCRRLASLDAMFVASPGLKKYKDQLPCKGVSVARELSKLGVFWLEKLFEVDLIGPETTRAQIDVLRGLQTGRPVAPRHKRKTT